MNVVLNLLADHTILLVFLLLALGTALGRVRFVGIQVGPAFVLFAALGISAAGTARGIDIAIPELLGTLGLVVFTYTIGVLNGPSFFATLRTGMRTMLAVVIVLCLAAAAAVGAGRIMGLPTAVIAGAYAGAVTNTPALAAAIDATGGSADPAVGYSITYIYGVVGMLVCAAMALRSRAEDAESSTPLTNLTIRVESTSVRTADVAAAYNGKIAFSRVQHGEAQPIEVARHDAVLRPGDLATVVGPTHLVERLAGELGHPSSHSLLADQRYLDVRRITLSKCGFAGHTVAQLGLGEKFGATVTRVRRGDSSLLANGGLRLQPGDLLRVIAPIGRVKDVAAYLGDSAHGASDINPVGFGIGISLGVLLGIVHIPLPGSGFSLGAAAGALIAGLIFGRLGRVGSVVTTMPNGAASTLSQFGMLIFLAYAGTTAGSLFVGALASGKGARIVLLGATVTTVSGLGLLVVGRMLKGIGGPRLAGMMAGAQTQPAVLAYANEHSRNDARVSMGYALVYPIAMITKILLAQVIGSM